MQWKDAYEKAHSTALQQYKNGKTGAAITTLLSFTDSIFNIIMNTVQNENEQIKAVNKIVTDLTEICTIIDDDIETDRSAFTKEYFASDTSSSHNQRIFDEYFEQYWRKTKMLSMLRLALGLGILDLFNSESEFGKKGVSMVNEEISRVKNWSTSKHFTRSERKDIVTAYKNSLATITLKTYERRLNAYWDAHQPERASLESEKQSLTKQIALLNKEISEIPEKTDGYADMVEFQKKVEKLTSEKKALGLFKFKARKALKAEIKSVKNEIAPIQERINSAIEEVKKRISPLQSRITAIDAEFTKSR